MQIPNQIFRLPRLFLLLFFGFANLAYAETCIKPGEWKFQNSLANIFSDNQFNLKASLPNNDPYLIFEITATNCNIFDWRNTSGVAVIATPYGNANFLGAYPKGLSKPLEILNSSRSKARYTYKLPFFYQQTSVSPVLPLNLNRVLSYEVTIELRPLSTSIKCKPSFYPDTTGESVNPWLKSPQLWMRANSLDYCEGYQIEINLKVFQIAGTSSDSNINCSSPIPAQLFFVADVAKVDKYWPGTNNLVPLNYYGAETSKNLISWLDGPYWPDGSYAINFVCSAEQAKPTPPTPSKTCIVILKSTARTK